MPSRRTFVSPASRRASSSPLHKRKSDCFGRRIWPRRPQESGSRIRGYCSARNRIVPFAQVKNSRATINDGLNSWNLSPPLLLQIATRGQVLPKLSHCRAKCQSPPATLCNCSPSQASPNRRAKCSRPDFSRPMITSNLIKVSIIYLRKTGRSFSRARKFTPPRRRRYRQADAPVRAPSTRTTPANPEQVEHRFKTIPGALFLAEKPKQRRTCGNLKSLIPA